MSAEKLYVISNSHMDPIWIWRLREGRSTWVNTCRATVRMLEEFPFLKFCRSSSAAYEWIEAVDPGLFARIRELVADGRWEPVGGWVEQSDTIITPAESLLRQAEVAKRYFREKFQYDVRIGYSVDSFGQNAGLPKLLNLGGFDRYVFMRPMEHEKSMPHLFRWRGEDGGCVTALRIRQAYSTLPDWQRRDEFFRWIDQLIADGDRDQTFFFGIGDHGGGIYRQQLEWLLEAAETRNIEFSTLADYFTLIEQQELPEVKGELVHHSPGCYAACSAIKRDMAVCEHALYKAEKILLEAPGPDAAEAQRKLDTAWNELLFNYFHDVYSGTCIKAAYQREVRNICGLVEKSAVDILEKRLSRYAVQIKSDFLTEGGILAWNPHAQPVRGLLQVDATADPNSSGVPFNVLIDAEGNHIPLQCLRATVPYGPNNMFRRLSAVVDLPASGVRMFACGRDAEVRETVGFARQRAAFERLSFPVIADRGDTWGHGIRRLGEDEGRAELLRLEELEDGPVVSVLRGCYRWKQSTFHADLYAWKGIPELFVRWSGVWNEIDDTVKCAWRTGIAQSVIRSGQAGTVIDRTPDDCEQPFLDFFAAVDGEHRASGFLSGALHSYDSSGSETLRLTVNRPVRYAEHAPNPPIGDEGYADIGDVEAEFWICDNVPMATLPGLARQRLWCIERLEATATTDGREFHHAEWRLEPAEVIALAQRPTGFRVWNPAGRIVPFQLSCSGRQVATGTLSPGEIRDLKLN